MTFPDYKFFLASQSPRRRYLLSLLNIEFDSFSVDVDETISSDENPVSAVVRLSELKMEAAEKQIPEGFILTADTIVVLDDVIIGKPVDKEDAFKILSWLSGNTHTVYTAYSLSNKYNKKKLSNVVKTQVTFRTLEPEEIKDYINTGSPMDKAGAYGIQDDFGAVFVEKINGCYYNVVGLPLSSLYNSIKEII